MPIPTTTPAADWRALGNDTNPPGSGAGEPVKNGVVLTRSGGDLEASERADAAAAAAAAATNNNNNLNRTGGKKTKKRAVRRKRTYKKSKKSYKNKRSYKSQRSVKRGGASVPIIFKIIKGNVENPLFEVELNPDQTGKDLYDRVNEWLEQNPAYLTEDEKAGARKLYTDNATVEVKYEDILSVFQSPTTIILLINHQPGAGDDELNARLRALQDGD